jgi:GH43 family beta-xylosidase
MTYTNPVISIQGVDHGDPAVLKYNGIYYLYHTGGFEVPVYRSNNLVDWEKCGVALRASEDPNHWAQIDLWAPEVIYENGTFYMYVTGAMKNDKGTANDDIRRIGVATSQSPTGPFELSPTPLTSEWSIDAHPFKDEDGTFYMFYNVRNEYTIGPGGYTGCGNVVDRMIGLTTLSGSPAMVVKPEHLWEGNKEKTWFWNEGPFVIKKDGVYYQMYSAGYFADNTYGVYYATSTVPMGSEGMNDRSWTKWQGGKAILQTNEHCLGPGHHVVVKGPNGVDDYAVYHGYEKGEQVRERRVRVGRLEWHGDQIWIEPPSGDKIPKPAAPSFDARFIDSLEEINQGMSDHRFESYVFETNLQFGPDKQGIVGGDAYYVNDGNRVNWRIDPGKGSFFIKMIMNGQEDHCERISLPHDIHYTAYHHVRIIKQDHKIQFYLDRLLLSTLNILEENGSGRVRLFADQTPPSFTGTILQAL